MPNRHFNFSIKWISTNIINFLLVPPVETSHFLSLDCQINSDFEINLKFKSVCFSCRVADYARRIKGNAGAHLVGDMSKFEQHLLETQEVMTVRGKVSFSFFY